MHQKFFMSLALGRAIAVMEISVRRFACLT